MPSRISRIATIGAFGRDVKTLKKHVELGRMLAPIQAIVDGARDLLSTKYRDHSLTGNRSGRREIHIEGDWLPVYFIDDDGLVLVLVLALTRTSAHDDLYSSQATKKLILGYRETPRHGFPL